jgi:hypothetical protein
MKPVAIALCCALLAGCTAETTKRCRDVCARQDDCEAKASPESNFDEGECVAACAALERDPDPGTVALVERHAECVGQATTCAAVLACH